MRIEGIYDSNIDYYLYDKGTNSYIKLDGTEFWRYDPESAKVGFSRWQLCNTKMPFDSIGTNCHDTGFEGYLDGGSDGPTEGEVYSW